VRCSVMSAYLGLLRANTNRLVATQRRDQGTKQLSPVQFLRP
jgi:hypothetical protein